ncbi:aldo/keto reductase [Amycolatopsis sp. NBC_00355]|uniref:aldo/keto reductase n=1 Tax=Amycolatopsis sp. NBC_00355 TaxID=2975957 RepID=UPI002E255F8B
MRELRQFLPPQARHPPRPAVVGQPRGARVERGASVSQVALAWLLGRSPAVLPIPGTTSIAHVRENLAAQDLVLSHGEIAAITGL